MGIPPNHPFIDGIFPYKPSSYWVPYGQPDFSHPSADLWGPIPRHNRDGPGGSNTTPPIWELFILPIYGDDWGIVQMALWNTHSKKLWKSHWHRILTRKKSQNSHWHGMDRVITKVITAFKETKITSEYLCSLFHQSLTQEKTTQTDIETNKSSGQAITPLITAGSVTRAISEGFWDSTMFKTCPVLTILICKASGYLYIFFKFCLKRGYYARISQQIVPC